MPPPLLDRHSRHSCSPPMVATGFQGLYWAWVSRLPSKRSRRTHLRRRLGLRVEEDRGTSRREDRERRADHPRARPWIRRSPSRWAPVRRVACSTTIRAADSSDLTCHQAVHPVHGGDRASGASRARSWSFLVGTIAGVLVFPIGFVPIPYIARSQRQDPSNRASMFARARCPDALEN